MLFPRPPIQTRLIPIIVSEPKPLPPLFFAGAALLRGVVGRGVVRKGGSSPVVRSGPAVADPAPVEAIVRVSDVIAQLATAALDDAAYGS